MATTDTTFKLFRSSDPGFSGITNATGGITTIFNTCLVTGGSTITLTSLVVSSGVATATYSGGHGYSNFGSTSVGSVILIAGVTDLTGLNGEKRISVTSSTEFTFDATGVSDGTASGTITAQQASAGWSAAYSGTNKYVFQSQDASSQQALLRIDHSGTTTYAYARGYESMTDINTGTDPFPTVAQSANGGYIFSSSGVTAVPWILVATSKAVLFLSDYNNDYSTPAGFCWDELENIGTTNIWPTLLIANNTTSTAVSALGVGNNNTFIYLCRDSAGTSKSVTAYRYGPQKSGSSSAFLEAVNPPVSGFYRVDKRYVWENTTNLTGDLSILYSSNFYFTTANPPLRNFYEITSGDLNGLVFLVTPNNSTTVGATIRVA